MPLIRLLRVILLLIFLLHLLIRLQVCIRRLVSYCSCKIHEINTASEDISCCIRQLAMTPNYRCVKVCLFRRHFSLCIVFVKECRRIDVVDLITSLIMSEFQKSERYKLWMPLSHFQLCSHNELDCCLEFLHGSVQFVIQGHFSWPVFRP